MLGERTIHALWNSIKEEIREQREADNRRLEPDEFGQFPDLDLACAKIVAHMTTPKPERPLRIARIIERKELPPLDLVPGLAIILTWGDQQAADHPTLEQQMFAANLQRLIFPLRKLTNATTRDVLGLLGVRSLRPLEATKHHFSDDDITPAAQQVFYILRSLMWDALTALRPRKSYQNAYLPAGTRREIGHSANNVDLAGDHSLRTVLSTRCGWSRSMRSQATGMAPASSWG